VRVSSSPLKNERRQQQQKESGSVEDKPGGSGKSGIFWCQKITVNQHLSLAEKENGP